MAAAPAEMALLKTSPRMDRGVSRVPGNRFGANETPARVEHHDWSFRHDKDDSVRATARRCGPGYRAAAIRGRSSWGHALGKGERALQGDGFVLTMPLTLRRSPIGASEIVQCLKIFGKAARQMRRRRNTFGPCAEDGYKFCVPKSRRGREEPALPGPLVFGRS